MAFKIKHLRLFAYRRTNILADYDLSHARHPLVRWHQRVRPSRF